MTGAEDRDRIIRQLADDLHESEVRRVPLAPLTDTLPDLTLAEAYRIQQINADRRVAAGEKIAGHKIGLTAKVMQELFNVSEPDYGHLMNTMIHDASKPLDLSELIDPQIEVEPAFVLADRLIGPGVTGDDVLAATSHIRVCFEVIDSRVVDWRIKLQDTVADNGSSARVILGLAQVEPRALALDDLDSVLELDGEVVERGNTSAILGHPANGVAWLANAISAFGQSLEAGHIVLPGTCTRAHRIAGHRNVRAEIAGLGEVSVELANSPTVTRTN